MPFSSEMACNWTKFPWMPQPCCKVGARIGTAAAQVREDGNTARRSERHEHGGLVLSVFVRDAVLVVIQEWDQPCGDVLARFPALTCVALSQSYGTAVCREQQSLVSQSNSCPPRRVRDG